MLNYHLAVVLSGGHRCNRLCHKTNGFVSRVFVAFEFWAQPASKCSTTLLIWPLLSVMLQSPSSLSSTSKGCGLRRKSALSWMRFRETARSVPMQSCNLTSLIVPDPPSDERFMSSFLVKQVGIQFYAGMPLIIDDAHPLGTLAVMDRVPHLLTAEQIDGLQILARRIVRELGLRRTRETQSPHGRPHLAQPSPQRLVTILIVEDNENLRNILHRTLEGHGFSVLAAADGAEALRLCQQYDGTIDVVVSDIVMPGPNGFELAVRVHAARPETKFLFITGFFDQFPELCDKYRGSILEKPFLPSELLRKVEDILNQAKAATGTEG